MIMSHIHNLSWKLVSQFISWDFCKYTSEQTEVEKSEHDVLTYLRNMIIERTERAASQVSEHEIIAKFIMEAKTIRTLSRMSCLENLAESIKKMCPDLTTVLDILLAHLECFLESLESNEMSENVEILESRMSQAVNEFSAKACRVIPEPLLPKILEAWHLSKTKRGKHPKNPDLYKKVLNCLQEEVKSFEMTVIANSLYDDEAFMRVICSGVDSQEFSIFSSQPPEHSDSLRLSERIQVSDLPVRSQYLNNSFSLDPSNKLPDSQQSLIPSCISMDPTSPHKLVDDLDRLDSLTRDEAFLYENPRPTSLFSSNQWKKRTSDDSLSPLKKSPLKRIYRSGSFSPLKVSGPLIINVQRSEDSEDEDSCFPTQKPVKLKCFKKKVFADEVTCTNRFSDGGDTSDCDKDPEIRFLTPTLFKKGQRFECPKVIYLSDEESCGSSIVTNYIDSQKNDPSFKPSELIFDAPIKNSKKETPKKGRPKDSKNKKARQTTLKDFATKKSLLPQLNDSHADFQKNVGKKKKLFNEDAASSLSAGSSCISRKRKPSKEIQSVGNKRHCADCKITFKTSNELKKHIFIFHTYDDLSD